MELELDDPRGSLTIELGGLDAAGQGVFARAGDATAIRVAPRRLAELADREAWAFRDRQRLNPVVLAPRTRLRIAPAWQAAKRLQKPRI